MGSGMRGMELIEEIGGWLAPAGSIALWWLGQASVALRLAGATVYIDPYLSENERRLMPPPFRGDEVTNADIVLVTHGHGDHFDREALPLIAAASPQATFIAPRPLTSQLAALVGDMGRVLVADDGQLIAWHDLRIVPVRAKHEEFDRGPDGAYPYLGYVLQGSGVTLYHAGDTIPYEGLAETLIAHAVDLALLPINGRDFYRAQRGIAGNMDAREAAELAGLLQLDTVVPVHYGMFAGNTASPGHFVEDLQVLAPAVHALMPAVGRACPYRPARAAPLGTRKAEMIPCNSIPSSRGISLSPGLPAQTSDDGRRADTSSPAFP